MGKLANIRDRMAKPKEPEGIFKDIGDYIASALKRELLEAMSNGSNSLDAITNTISAIEPAVRTALKGAGGEIVATLEKHRDELKKALTDSQKTALSTQSALIKVLSGIRIPDHSMQLSRLEAKNVDLSPISKKLDAMCDQICERMDEEKDEEPCQWVFDVKRNSNGLITEVIATES